MPLLRPSAGPLRPTGSVGDPSRAVRLALSISPENGVLWSTRVAEERARCSLNAPEGSSTSLGGSHGLPGFSSRSRSGGQSRTLQRRSLAGSGPLTCLPGLRFPTEAPSPSSKRFGVAARRSSRVQRALPSRLGGCRDEAGRGRLVQFGLANQVAKKSVECEATFFVLFCFPAGTSRPSFVVLAEKFFLSGGF